MPQIPQAQDYGARPGLRSSRVDLPGQGETVVADALAAAATAFSGMAIEHKQKDDALSYSNAKNEYLIADIQERDRLQDDQKFATHDERYRTAMKGHYERLFPTVKSRRDQHLFDADARLMNERGAVAVGENARTKEIDWNIGNARQNAADMQGVIMAASDAQTAQDGMFTVLEQYASLRAQGLISETAHQTETQDFVSETAFKRLVAMDPKDREVLLERSITMAKTNGRITRDQIKAGNGSGSIADFLPLDQRVQMLETTRKGNEHDDTMSQAYEIFDKITDLYTDPNNVNDAIKKASKGQEPDVRTALKTMSREYRVSEDALLSSRRQNIMDAGTAMINAGDNPENMDGTDWATMGLNQQEALKEAYNANMENRQFGTFDVVARPMRADGTREPGMSAQLWRSIPYEQKPIVNLKTPEWKMSFTSDGWHTLLKEQEQIKKSIDTATPAPFDTGMSNHGMVTSMLVGKGLITQTGRDIEDSEVYQNLMWAMDRATQDAQVDKGSKLTNKERKDVLVEIMVPMAFTDDWTLWANKDKDDRINIAAMSSKQLKTARLSWRDAAKDPATESSAGVPVSYRQSLEKMAKDMDLTPDKDGAPDQDDYERAYFALKHGHLYGWDVEEVKRRLRND